MATLFLAQTKRNGGEQTTNKQYNNSNDACFVPIKGLALEVETHSDSQLLITLTAPDTWNTVEDKGTWFGIEVDGKIVARGLYTAGENNQRVPISLNTAILKNKAGKVKIVGKWCNWGGGISYIGSWSQTTLTVLRVD